MKFTTLAGLPRSGSTLLLNILAQNSGIQVSGTSGLIELLISARNSYTTSLNINAQPKDEMDERFKRFCKWAIDGWSSYYSCSVYIDKNRGWPKYFEFLESVGVEPKMVITIRDIRAIASSMEKLYRKNTLRIDPSQWNNKSHNTVDDRVRFWLGEGLIGEAGDQIKDLINRNLINRVHIVKYEDLTSDPEKVLMEILTFMEIEYYEFNLGNIEQITQEDDRLHGIPDLHNIRPVLSPVEEDWNSIIGVDLSKAIVNGNKWFYDRFYQ